MSATLTTAAAPGLSTVQRLREIGLADDVLASRSLLSLEDDWDGRGSPGYAEATWERAVDLLIRLAGSLWSESGVRLEAAEVLPGSQGDIGLELQTATRRLLISVPPLPTVAARYYGHDRTKTTTTKGSFDPDLPNHWLVEWLAE